MAHKTNNPTHDFDDKQFDLMLRRQLRRNDGASVSCAGFDAETASAYLERSLLVTAHQKYESHLADCAPCRRHVIALTRLQTELNPQPVMAASAPVLPIAQPESFWTRWMAQASVWWEAVNLNWGLAGAGALATVLIAAVAFNGWQKSADQAAVSVAARAPQQSEESAPALKMNEGLAAGAAPVVGDSSLMASTSALPDTAVGAGENKPAAAAPNAPLPELNSAKPQLAGTGLSFAAPSTPLRVIEAPADVVAMTSEKIAAPVVLPSGREIFGTGFTSSGDMRGTAISFNQPSSGNGGLMPIQLRTIQAPMTVNSLNVVKDQLERQSNASELVVAHDNRKLADGSNGKDAESKSAKESKNETGRVRAVINTLTGQRGVMSFVPSKGDDSRTKEAEKDDDPTAIKPLTKRVNGHTFYFERGFWIDEDYRSDTTLPLVKLTRGSERYQNMLIENPTLETFFQLGQVIVVWKGKVYEVRK